MRLWIRIILYLGGGGLILMWIDPPSALGLNLLILALIVGAAYLDRRLFRHHPRKTHPGNVVSLKEHRQQKSRRQGPWAAGRERRVLQTVFTSSLQNEVDDLLTLLRAEGLNPMMVSQQSGRGQSGAVYEVRLPAHEISRAKPLIQFFLVKSAKHPS